MTVPQRWTFALAGVLIAHIGWLVAIAIDGHRRLLTIAGAVFAVILVAAAFALNAWFRSRDISARSALASNSRLMALVYGWGAFAMQGLYFTPLTGLRWQHGWQYAVVLLFMACAAWGHGDQLAWSSADRQHLLMRFALPLAIFQALAGGFGVTFLALSGKLVTERSDWAANQVFFFVALMVTILAALTVRTHAHLSRRAPRASPSSLSGP